MKTLFIYLLIIFKFAAFSHAETYHCPFCDADKINKQIVFETEGLMVLLDTSPRCVGHLLVIPKRHVAQADELLPSEWQEFGIVFPKTVQVFKKAYHTDHYLVLQKNGIRAFQSELHVHFHLFPMQSQTWSDVFDVKPKLLSDEEFIVQRDALRLLFQET